MMTYFQVHTKVSSQILPRNHFKGLAIGLQGHRHLSEINLIIKMNETISAKVILYKSLYNAIFNMHISKKFMKQRLFT